MAKTTARPAAPSTTPEAPKAGEARYKVQAIRDGYYDHIRRREGDVFIVNASAFSKTWMQRVDDDAPERITTGKAHLKNVHDDIMAGRLPQGTQFASDEDNNPLRVKS